MPKYACKNEDERKCDNCLRVFPNRFTVVGSTKVGNILCVCPDCVDNTLEVAFFEDPQIAGWWHRRRL